MMAWAREITRIQKDNTSKTCQRVNKPSRSSPIRIDITQVAPTLNNLQIQLPKYKHWLKNSNLPHLQCGTPYLQSLDSNITKFPLWNPKYILTKSSLNETSTPTNLPFPLCIPAIQCPVGNTRAPKETTVSYNGNPPRIPQLHQATKTHVASVAASQERKEGEKDCCGFADAGDGRSQPVTLGDAKHGLAGETAKAGISHATRRRGWEWGLARTREKEEVGRSYWKDGFVSTNP